MLSSTRLWPAIIDDLIPADIDAGHRLHAIELDKARLGAVGAFSRQITPIAIAEQAIHVACPVGADHDRFLSVAVAAIPVDDDATLRILDVVIFYIEPHRRGDLEEGAVGLTLYRRIQSHTGTVTTVRLVPATVVLIKLPALRMCAFSIMTGAVVATVTAGVLASVLCQFPE